MKVPKIQMTLGFDCNAYPKLADYLYGASKLEHCSNDILFSKSGNEFDLFGDLSLIICLLALNYISNRTAMFNTDDAVETEIDIDMNVEEDEINNENMINKSDLICPQCKGKRVFMNNNCDLCDGMFIYLTINTYIYIFINNLFLFVYWYYQGTGYIEYNYEQNTKSLPSIDRNKWDSDEI